MEQKNKNFRNMLAFLGLPILIILIFVIINGINPGKSYNYSEIVEKFKTHQVTKYTLNLGSGNMDITLNTGEIINYTTPSVNLIYSDISGYVREYNEKNPENPMVYDLIRPMETSWLVNAFTFVILPVLMLCLTGWLFMRKINIMGEGGGKLGFGRSKSKNAEKDGRKATFNDVAGADEEKEELYEIVDFLKNPEKYNNMGARIPKGVLLVGPPGTGKTLLARAVAGEADVPFFSMSGSDFVEMFVGVGASRVRDLFEQAKKSTPCIIFIDEIDAVGRRRGAGVGGGHDEREQTLNQLLVEMDGFGVNEGVIVIAATNRSDILDPALTRPGRFDRQVYVGYPDIKGREEILRVHAKGKKFAPDVQLKTIAKSTAGFTGADLENLINEAALLAVRRKKEVITMSEIEESTVKVTIGTEKKSRVITEKEKRETAYHESGHAIATYFCETQEKVHEISIIPRGHAGGYTLSLPEKDVWCEFKSKILENIVVLLGGFLAEKLVIGDTSTGVSNDIERATQLATSMVTKYGMSEKLGPIVYKSNSSDMYLNNNQDRICSEETSNQIDLEIKNIISSCYDKTQKILKDNIDKLHKLAEYLVKHEKMNGEQFELFMKEEALS